MSDEGPDLDSPKTTVGSIVHAVNILRYLADLSEPQGVTGIAKAAGVSPSSCFNIMRTLVAQDLVNFDPRRKTYSLGLGVVELAGRALARSAFNIVRPHLQELADAFHVTTAAWRVTRRRRLVLVGVVEGDQDTHIQFRLGQRLPMFAGSNGQCIAAVHNVPKAELEKEFKALRWHAAPSFDAWLEQIAATSERGWAIDVNMFMAGVTSLAAPIRDADGRVAFCISATSFTGQLNDERLQSLAHELLSLAASIEATH